MAASYDAGRATPWEKGVFDSLENYRCSGKLSVHSDRLTLARKNPDVP
jgi:hypothetical protein